MSNPEEEKEQIVKVLSEFQKRELPLKVKGKNAGKPKWLVVPVNKYKGLHLVLTETRFLMFQIKGFGQFQGINIKDINSLNNLKELLKPEVIDYLGVRLNIMSELNGTGTVKTINTNSVEL